MKTFRLICGIVLCAGLVSVIAGGGIFYARKRTAYQQTKIEPQQTLHLSAFTEVPDKERICLCAARGLSSVRPENTTDALRAAGEAGFAFVQMDVGVTADAQAVLLYDDTLDRMAGRHDRLAARSYEELCKIPLCNGANVDKAENPHVPLLTDALEICKEYGMQPILTVRSVAAVRLLAECAALQQTQPIFFSTQKSVLSALRELPGERYLQTDLLSQEAIVYASKAHCGIVFDVRDPYNTDALVRKAARVQLWAWNVNRREAVRRLTQLGVFQIGTTVILPLPESS